MAAVFQIRFGSRPEPARPAAAPTTTTAAPVLGEVKQVDREIFLRLPLNIFAIVAEEPGEDRPDCGEVPDSPLQV